MSKHTLHPSILRAYDIRGIFNDTLNLVDARAILVLPRFGETRLSKSCCSWA